jgi:hypothetical protein
MSLAAGIYLFDLFHGFSGHGNQKVVTDDDENSTASKLLSML